MDTELVPSFRPAGSSGTPAADGSPSAPERHDETADEARSSKDAFRIARATTEATANASAADEARRAPSRTIAVDDDVTNSLTVLDFGVHVGMRYHAKRRAWYDWLHRLMMVIVALGATATAATIFGGLFAEAADLAVMVALAGAIEIGFSLPERARREEALYLRFNMLAAEIAAATTVDHERLRAWDAKRLMIETDADDPLQVLERICHNVEAEARGYPAEALYRIRIWQRLFAQIATLPPYLPVRARAT